MGSGLTHGASVRPRVTVIIPTYNWSTVLPYSIGSVLAQMFTDFELLVVGDGCTDDSEVVVQGIDDPRVRWINIAPTGHQSGPNNEGLRQARGELIAYLGHDDLWLPHHLARHVAALESSDVSCSLAAIIGEDESVIRCAMLDLSRGWWAPPSAIAHRKAVTVELGGWRDHRTMTDAPEAELLRRLLTAGKRYVLVPRMTVIKLSAGLRRNVYQERPSHEQAAWWKRIQTEPDVEAAVMGAIIARLPPRGSSFIGRVWQLFREPWRWSAVVFRRKGAHTRAYQKFKGVDHALGSSKR